jgi:hypothetical protein
MDRCCTFTTSTAWTRIYGTTPKLNINLEHLKRNITLSEIIQRENLRNLGPSSTTWPRNFFNLHILKVGVRKVDCERTTDP